MNVIEDGTLYDIDKDERVVMIRGGGIEDLISGFGAIVNVGTLLRELDPER